MMADDRLVRLLTLLLVGREVGKFFTHLRVNISCRYQGSGLQSLAQRTIATATDVRGSLDSLRDWHRTRSASDGLVQPARPVDRWLFDDIVDRRNRRIAVSFDD